MALRGYKPAATVIESAVRFLIADCGPYVLAFPAGWVRGILTPEEGGSGQDIWSAGASSPLTDLAHRLLVSPKKESMDRRIILYGNGTCFRAFAVDQVFELIDTNRTDLRPLPVQYRSAERTRLSGYLLYKNTIALLVNPLWLLETNNRVDAFQSCMIMPEDDTARSCQAVIDVSQNQVQAEPVK
jgi:hypothetical protein